MRIFDPIVSGSMAVSGSLTVQGAVTVNSQPINTAGVALANYYNFI